MRSQKEIFQDILDNALSVIDDKWVEIKFDVRMDDEQSGFVVDYFLEENGILIEKSLPYVGAFIFLFEELREHLSIGDKPKFSHCKLSFFANGKFNADYSYELVDWDLKY